VPWSNAEAVPRYTGCGAVIYLFETLIKKRLLFLTDDCCWVIIKTCGKFDFMKVWTVHHSNDDRYWRYTLEVISEISLYFSNIATGIIRPIPRQMLINPLGFLKSKVGNDRKRTMEELKHNIRRGIGRIPIVNVDGKVERNFRSRFQSVSSIAIVIWMVDCSNLHKIKFPTFLDNYSETIIS
jgi:hypothetical protein